jgi:hypothetical protein
MMGFTTSKLRRRPLVDERVVRDDPPVVVRLGRAQALHHPHEAVQVGAGAERVVAGAGEDRDADVRIVAHVLPRVGEAAEHLGVQRVPHLGAVHRERRDAARFFVEERRLGHRRCVTEQTFVCQPAAPC